MGTFKTVVTGCLLLLFHISSLLKIDFPTVACKNKIRWEMNTWHLQ